MEKNKLTKEEVKHVAKLGNLILSDTELEKFTAELEEVIDYNVAHLNQVDSQGVEPLYQVHEETNKTREDNTEPSLTSEQVLKNANSEHNNFFKVKAILDSN